MGSRPAATPISSCANQRRTRWLLFARCAQGRGCSAPPIGNLRQYWAALDEAIDPADAEQRLSELVAELERPYPSAAACLAEDLTALCVHLKYFPRLRKRFRSSNLLERSLEEVRRRTKVMGRFPGETSCLSLCWAVLDLFLAGARGLGLSDLEYRQVVQMKTAREQPADTLPKIA